MEELEIQHIRINKDSLMETTICNSQLLAILESARHLAKVDVQDIKAERTDLASSSRFYELIQTRAGAYQGLIRALEETNQSGAVNILRGLYDKNIGPSDNQYVHSVERKADGESSRRGLLQKIAISKENYEDTYWNETVGNIARKTTAGAWFNNLFGSNCTHVTNQLDREILAVISSEGDLAASITGNKLVFDLTQLKHAHQRILPKDNYGFERSNKFDFLKIYFIEADGLVFCGQKKIPANVSYKVHYANN